MLQNQNIRGIITWPTVAKCLHQRTFRPDWFLIDILYCHDFRFIFISKTKLIRTKILKLSKKVPLQHRGISYWTLLDKQARTQWHLYWACMARVQNSYYRIGFTPDWRPDKAIYFPTQIVLIDENACKPFIFQEDKLSMANLCIIHIMKQKFNLQIWKNILCKFYFH